MKHVAIISPGLQNITNFDSLKSILGKKVHSKSGDYIGRVRDVLFLDNRVYGIKVTRGTRVFFFDKEYIGSNPDDIIFLSIDPVVLLIGKKVFDVKGKEIGTVKSIKRVSTKNQYESLIVKKNLITKPIEIERASVSTTKKNILLNISL